MPNKELTAKVRIDASQAHKTVDKLINKIKKINEVVNKPAGTSSLEKNIDKALLAQEKLKQATLKTEQAQKRVAEIAARTQLTEERLATQKLKTQALIDRAAEKEARAEEKKQREIDRANKALKKQREKQAKIQAEIEKINAKYRQQYPLMAKIADKIGIAKNQTGQWAKKQSEVLSKLTSAKSPLNSICNKLMGLVGAYMGLQTISLGIETSDKLTSAENQLNNLKGGNETLTAETMDKVYAASQRARTGYTGMLSNVAKTMTLAGDSFQGNIDNAIRFQEIMAKSYAVGGASDAEAATSMYQLVQALGSGVLQGDELRSVREGAPLAYKAIEEFAQGVLKSELSLKDMAAEGVITSDIVVAAIMNMENGVDNINDKFDETKRTFEQTWTAIKNTATKAFEPVLQRLNDFLNSDKGQKTVKNITNALVGLALAVGWVIDVFAGFFNWCADNWGWLQHVIVGALILMITWTLLKAGVSIFCAIQEIIAWMAVNSAMLITLATIFVIVAAVLGLVYVFYLWKTGAIDTCDAIVSALVIVGIAVAIIGLLIGSWIMVIVAAVIAAVALIIYYLDYFLGAVYTIGAAIYNFIIGLIDSTIQGFWTLFIEPFIGYIEWFVNAFTGGFDSIGDAFKNLCGQLLSNFISFAKPFTKIWDAITGMSATDAITEAQNKLKNWGKNENAISYSVEAPTVSSMTGGALPERIAYSDAWNKGMEHGVAAQDWLNGIGSTFQNQAGAITLPDPGGENTALQGAYDPSGALDDIQKGIDTLNGTGNDIKGSMDIADDDLEWMRKIAEMEWRNEFTTAEIKVDMTNNNTVNTDRDLDGIVEYLGEVLLNEMTSVADGVHY